jgi:predicted small secreted protein
MRTASTIFRRTLLIITVAALAVVLTACKGGAGSGSDHKESGKGAKKGMNTYNIGRFSIDVPAEMKEAGRTHEFRYAEIEEFLWPQNMDREEARKEIWAKRIAEINSIAPPKGKKKTIIEEKEMSGIGSKAKAVFYYRSDTADDEGFWDLLVDYGDVGAWFKFRGLLEAKEEMLAWVVEIAKSYNNNRQAKVNSFHTAFGNITLPYLEQESSHVRFEGHPLDLMLSIEMTETHSVEEAGLVDRLKTAIATNFAPTVDVKQVRARKRMVAGLPGEEIVSVMSDKDGTIIDFGWEYAGKEDSGEHPEIQIIMEAPEGKLDEKLRIWDSILDSMKPLYR